MPTAHSPIPKRNFHFSLSNAFCNSRSTKCTLTTESFWRTDLVESCRNIDLSVPIGTVWPAPPPWRSQFITLSPVDPEEKTMKGFCLWKNPLSLANWIYKVFFFFLPMWPVFLSSSSSHLPSPRSVSFRMPFDRWKNGPQNRKPLQARSAFNPQVESLEFWTHITDAENQVNSAENTTWLTYCDLVNHFNHTSFWNVGWFHVLKRKEKQKNYKSPFEITDPLCKATHSSIDYHL